MATTPDPTAALTLFQRDLDQIPLTPSQTDPDLLFHLDQPGDGVRLTFVTLQNRTVTALAVFLAVDPVDGVLHFHGFFAVPAAFRNEGRATHILKSALRQMEHGFAQADVSAIRVEVVVDAGNPAAQRVAAAAISPTPDPMTDPVSGQPALRYAATLKHTTH